MEWKIEYIESEGFLYIKTWGSITSELANTYVKETIEAANRHQCHRQIVDHREAVFAFSLAEYYERPDINQQMGLSLTWRIAMVFKELNRDTQFMEDVFRNRGYCFRQFDDMDKAKTWVLGNEP